MTRNRNTGRSLALTAAEGILANLLLGTLYIWSVLRNPLLELFPDWTNGMLSVIFGIHNLFVCGGILLGGSLSGRCSSRKIFALFAVLVFAGLGGFSLLPLDRPGVSYVLALIFFCAFAAVGIGLGISAVQSSTIPWFPHNSGLISGALYMALGLSSVLLAAIAERLLPILGVQRMMLVFGVLVLVVAAVILLDRGAILPPPTECRPGAAQAAGLSPREMLRAPMFWTLMLWNICLRSAGLILLDHTASIAAIYGGTVLASMMISPANAVGCLSVGSAMDHFGLRRMMYLTGAITLLAGGLLLWGTGLGSYPVILAGVLLGGLAYGGSNSSYSAAVKDLFGEKYYAKNFGISNLAMGCAALVSSTSGFVLDAGGGSYTGVMVMVLLLAVPALLSCVLAGKNATPCTSPGSRRAFLYLDKTRT